MFIIADKTYSLESLKQQCLEISPKNMEEWEKDIWSFLKDWFNDKIDSIEIKTSGSTSEPKVIKHQKKHMRASAEMTCSFFGLKDTDFALLCLSVKSIGGMMMMIRALVSGMNLIVIKPSSNPLKSIEKHYDFVAMVPFQAQSVFNENPDKWKWIKNLIIGGGIVSKALKSKIIESKVNAYSTFGMTETISHFALNKIGKDSIYTILNDVSIEVNEYNCLSVSAPKLGVNNLQTNDIVDLISEKQFIWLGRKDNALETGGFKVIPEVLERQIEHLIPFRFIICAIQDDLLNNKLILITESDEVFDLNRLKPLLSKYECPKLVFNVLNFEETKTGKINRKATMKLLMEKL